MSKDINDSTLSRYRGCLLGGAVGDALGYPVEFTKENRIFGEYGEKGIQTLDEAGDPAHITDDTQMTLFAANAIIYSKTHPDQDLSKCIRAAYIEWLSTQDYYRLEKPKMWIYENERLHRRRAPGITCLNSLYRLRELPEGMSSDDYYAKNNSKGCGTVMRAAPYGLIFRPEPGYKSYGDEDHTTLRFSKYDAMLTHGHELGYLSSMALAKMVFEIVTNECTFESERLENVLRRGMIGEGTRLGELLTEALALATDSEISDLDAIHRLGEGWIAEEALAIAVFCAVRYQNDFAGAIRAAVNHKGDSDSTGAVCGNLLGAWLGAEAVYEAFDLKYLELTDLIESVAEDLYLAANSADMPKKGENPVWDERYYDR